MHTFEFIIAFTRILIVFCNLFFLNSQKCILLFGLRARMYTLIFVIITVHDLKFLF